METDREGPFITAAQLNTSSFTNSGHMSGLTQIQSGKGICCSVEVWDPEHARAGQLYRAFMEHNMSSDEALTKQFENMYGEMHHDRRGDKVSSVGWQLANHRIWIPATMGENNEEIPWENAPERKTHLHHGVQHPLQTKCSPEERSSQSDPSEYPSTML